MSVLVALPLALLISAFVISALVIRLSIPVATHFGLVDRPSGHKRHDRHVPLVGGLGVYVALVSVLLPAAWVYPEYAMQLAAVLAGASVLFAVGLIDDIEPLGVGIRFGAQAVAASIAAFWGGIVLEDFGVLVGTDLVALGFMALPMTLFATAGVINALNMTDGIDGLTGSLSLVSLSLLAVVAYLGGAQPYLLVILALLGAVGGFLFFNMRCCGRHRASVFLGDAGSTLLGFLFACLFIGLSQGESRAMSPVTALWLFAVPLYDTIAIMLRRVWMRRSPFDADRAHLHHLLLDAGCTVSQSVITLSALQLVFGLVGLSGWYFGALEPAMFAAFLGLFLGYLQLVSRPRRFVPAARVLHRRCNLTVAGATGIFISKLPVQGAEQVLKNLMGDKADEYGYRLFACCDAQTGAESRFAVVSVGCEYTMPKVVKQLRHRLDAGGSLCVRQLIPREARRDRRQASKTPGVEQRRRDRRVGELSLIASYSAASDSRPADTPGDDVAGEAATVSRSNRASEAA